MVSSKTYKLNFVCLFGMFRSAIISVILVVCSFHSSIAKKSKSQDPPEKIRLLERIESSKWISHSAKWLLREYSLGLLSKTDINVLSSLDANRYLLESEVGASGVILYEFATGTGPSTRYFYENSAFTKSFIQSPGVSWILNSYLTQYDSINIDSFQSTKDLFNIRYQFSPLLVPFRPNTWDFSVQQHIETLNRKNLSQIIVGSFNADILYVDSKTIQLHIWNKTSKKSLFAGIGKRLQRPLPLGTVQQHIIFNIRISDLDCIVLNSVP